jgi:DNA-directed RNA polymerase subunit F
MEEIVSEKLITNAEAKEILKERKKEIELGYEQKNSLDYLKNYDKLTAKNSEKLVEDLKKVSKLRERQIIAISNILPQDLDDLRLIMEKDYTNLSDEEKKLILESVKGSI